MTQSNACFRLFPQPEILWLDPVELRPSDIADIAGSAREQGEAMIGNWEVNGYSD
jgi:hypothetical protein